MRKIFLLSIISIFSIQFAAAQNKKIYVSREGGKKKLLTLWKTGYNFYHFSNDPVNGCDTLICKGAGFEVCKIDKNIIKMAGEEPKYRAFNSAIAEAEKRIRKSRMKEGNFDMIAKGQKLSVSFKNANPKGEADLIITLL
jgi:hypothetical protein